MRVGGRRVGKRVGALGSKKLAGGKRARSAAVGGCTKQTHVVDSAAAGVSSHEKQTVLPGGKHVLKAPVVRTAKRVRFADEVSVYGSDGPSGTVKPCNINSATAPMDLDSGPSDRPLSAVYSHVSSALQAACADAEAVTQPITQLLVCMPKQHSAFSQQHSLVIALSKEQFPLIAAFTAAYRKDSVNISGCLLVPDWKTAWFNHHLQGLAVLKQYAAGTVAAFPTKLVYCPLRPAKLESINDPSSGKLIMSFNGLVANTPAVISADSQASHNFISTDFVRRVGLHMTPTSGEVRMGNSVVERVVGVCSVKFRVGALHDQAAFYVLQMHSAHDLVLGETYLKSRKAVLDYANNSFCVRKGERLVTVTAGPSPLSRAEAGVGDATQSSTPRLLSAMQVRRLLRKPAVAAGSYLVMLREKSGDGSAVDGSCEPSDEERLAEVDLTGPCQDEQLRALLLKYKHVWPGSLPPGLPPHRDITAEHTIPLVPGSTPPKQVIYRLSPAEKEEVVRQVKELLAKGYIQPSISPYGAPLLFVPKPNGTLRMCTDWRALNKQTIKDVFPLPRIDDLIDSLAGSTVYSSIDLAQGYYQFRISDEDVPKTAFKTHFGLFEWKVLSFGLTNAPATFQRAMNHVLAPYIGKFVCVYIDDICIYSKSPAEHLRHLELVLQALAKEKLYMQLPKCSFNKTEIKFLGHLISHNSVRPDPAKVRAVADWPVPQDLRQLRSFLGLCNYFRRFIPRYAETCLPLTALLKKDVPFDCSTPVCVAAMDKLKACLCSEPVLRLPDMSKPFTVICDASGFAVGAVLLQEEHPVAFESRKLTPAEVNYSVPDRELLAVIHALTVWRCYLHGPTFTLMTDHKPLISLDTSALSGRQARWQEFLSRFHYTWVYKQGSQNMADALSRHPHYGVMLLSILTRSQARAGQAAGADVAGPSSLSPEVAGSSSPPDASPPAAAAAGAAAAAVDEAGPASLGRAEGPASAPAPWKERCIAAGKSDKFFSCPANTKALTYQDGLWLLNGKVWVPANAQLRKDLIVEHHCTPYSGHFGEKRTLENMKKLFHWPGMARDVRQYCMDCDSCQRNKSSTLKPVGKLQPLPIPTRKWESIGMDFITQLPCTDSGYDCILVVIDRLSKLTHLVPLTCTATAADVAELFVDCVVKHHGLPTSIVTDRDSKFTSMFWQTVLQIWGVKSAMSTAFHPQTDGQTERVNRVLEEYLRHFVSPRHTDWDKYLPCAEFALNDSYQASIGMTPFYMTYGQHPLTPVRAAFGKAKAPAAVDFVQNIGAAVKQAKDLLQVAQQRQKAYVDSKRRCVEHKCGDLVLLSTEHIRLKSAGTQKLLPRFVGPFSVEQKIGSSAYRLKLPPELKVHPVFHVSLLKPYKGDGSVQPPAAPLYFNDENEAHYEVEEVLQCREKKRGNRVYRSYLIKWAGYGHEHNTWEPEKNLNPAALKSYWDAQGGRRVVV